MQEKNRVVVYITRGEELLTFEHNDEGLLPGLQIVGGGIEKGETAEEAAIRETLEESGLHLENPIFLGNTQTPVPEQLHHHTPYRIWNQSFVWLKAHPSTPDYWEHMVQSDGSDTGMIYRHTFLPIENIQLDSDQDAFLPQLEALLHFESGE